MFLRLPEPELRELISAFLHCLKGNINKGVVMFTGLRLHDLKMLKFLGNFLVESLTYTSAFQIVWQKLVHCTVYTFFHMFQFPLYIFAALSTKTMTGS